MRTAFALKRSLRRTRQRPSRGTEAAASTSFPQVFVTLSPRQRQTLLLLLEGFCEKDAARRLGLSVNTLHIHVRSVYRRFGVNSRAELLALVLRTVLWSDGATLLRSLADQGAARRRHAT